MKYFLALLTCSLVSTATFARIWYVDPSISSPLVLADLNVAMDSVSTGDTVMVRGTHFANIAIQVPLTLYGEGYSDISGNKTTIFGRVDIESDSVHISGFRIQAWSASFPITIWGGANNITIERCRIEGQVSLQGAIENVTFRNNVFQQYSNGYSMDISISNIDTLVVENNVFDTPYYFGGVATSSGMNTVLIRNNLFLGTAAISLLFDDDCSASLYNNIFFSRAPQDCPSCTYSHNLFWNDPIGYDTLITGNNNLNHVPPGLVGYSGGDFDFNADYSLSDTSQCHGAGLNGVDIGITGGYYPYFLGEGPKIPLVTYANIGSSADEQDPVYYLQFDSRARTDVFHPGTYISNNDSIHLVQAEYWIDSIPIPGTGTLVSLTATDTLFYIDSIPGLQLDTGAHTISVRTRDDRGNWGFVFSDETRNESYEVDIKQTSSYYIRQGAKTKLEVEVTNRSTVDLAEQYLFISSSKYFEIEFDNPMDSIDGVFVGGIPKGVTAGSKHLVPIWLGKLDAHSITHLKFYLTFPQFSPHEKIEILTEVIGDPHSSLQLAYNISAGDSLFHGSLFCGTLASAVDALSDTLAIAPLTYVTIIDSIRAWTNRNHMLFRNVLSLNDLSRPFLQNVFGVFPDSMLIDHLNARICASFVSRMYNSGRVSAGSSELVAAGSTRDGSSGCACTTPLDWWGISTHRPLEPVSDFMISSGCRLRCECECEGGSWTRMNNWHHAVDIYYTPLPTLECITDVMAMVGGMAHRYGDTDRGLGVVVESNVNGTIVNMFYHHLCSTDIPDTPAVYVQAGEVIGKLGKSGANGPHLHIDWEDVFGLPISPECYSSLWSEYPYAPHAFKDETCLPPYEFQCFDEIETCTEDSFYVSYNRQCNSGWVESHDASCGDGITSDDPNDKVGNIGYGAPRYILPTDQLHYGIFFENIDSATTAAQVIHIVDTLDVTKVDASTFYFESITAGEMLIVLPDSVHLQELDTVYMKEPVNGCYVHVQASFDPLSGIADILLTSLDTFPPYAPVDGLWEGLLPPDTTDFDGNGMVTFRTMPIPTIPDGTVIYKTAHIIFDSNPAIQTGTWFNTIDGEAPTSFVHALPATTNDTSFVVHWEGTDGGSGVVDFDIYAKLSGDTAFTQWFSHTSLDSATFVGVWNGTYQFYSVAYDSVGNMEIKLPMVEAFTTLLELHVGMEYIVNTEEVRVYPNPTSGKLTVEAMVQQDEDLTIDIFDLLGSQIGSFVIKGPSGTYLRHEIDLDDQADGVYILRLNGRDDSVPKKFVLKKN